MKGSTLKKVAIVVLIGFLAYKVLDTLNHAGVFKKINESYDGTVTAIYQSIYGPEDLDVDYESGQLFISSTDRWAAESGQPNDADGIYYMFPNRSDSIRRMFNTYQGEFHPHGISYFSDGDDRFLFVVNHNANGDYVELFEIVKDTLHHRRSIKSDQMCCPNDVVGVGPGSFYVTNDHGQPAGWKRTVEDYLRMPWSNLMYFDGNEFSVASEGLRYANGVNISRDGRFIYVTHTTGQEMVVFRRNAATGSLRQISSVYLATGVDNVHVDDSGDIWIGCHPKLLDFVAHASDSTRYSPSQVLRLRPSADHATFAVQEVFMDDGRTLSGSSAAVSLNDELWIGVVFDNSIFRGKLNP